MFDRENSLQDGWSTQGTNIQGNWRIRVTVKVNPQHCPLIGWSNRMLVAERAEGPNYNLFLRSI